MARQNNCSMSNEKIAETALSFIDNYGIDALSFRKLSDLTGIPTMTICNRFGSKESLLKAALSVMLDEHPAEAIPGEAWQDTLRRVAHCHRAMALSHPGAFMLFVQTPSFEEPILSYTERVFLLHGHQDIPEDMPFIFLSVMHSFLPGFQLVESMAKSADKDRLPAKAQRFISLFTEEAFDRDLEIIIAGLTAKYDLPTKPPCA